MQRKWTPNERSLYVILVWEKWSNQVPGEHVLSGGKVPVAYCCTRPFPIGLLQELSVWTSCQPHSAHPVCSERWTKIRAYTPALVSLHWLCVPERISFKLTVLAYRSIHGTSPSYPQSCFTCVADMTSRRQLRSSACRRPQGVQKSNPLKLLGIFSLRLSLYACVKFWKFVGNSHPLIPTNFL